MRVRGIVVATMTVMLLAGLAGCQQDAGVGEDAPVAEPEQGGSASGASQARERAPEFTLEKAGGGQVSLSDYEGKILVIDFWATSCTGCIKELPAYQELYEQWDHDRVEYLGVSLDPNMKLVEAWLQRHPELDLAMALATEEMLDAYLGPQRIIPAARVIAPDGTIAGEFGPGPASEEVAQLVDRLLEETQAEEAE